MVGFMLPSLVRCVGCSYIVQWWFVLISTYVLDVCTYFFMPQITYIHTACVFVLRFTAGNQRLSWRLFWLVRQGHCVDNHSWLRFNTPVFVPLALAGLSGSLPSFGRVSGCFSCAFGFPAAPEFGTNSLKQLPCDPRQGVNCCKHYYWKVSMRHEFQRRSPQRGKRGGWCSVSLTPFE